MITSSAPKTQRARLIPAYTVMLFVLGCSVYAGFSELVVNQENYRFFPPFLPYYNHYDIRHLGAEYYNIAKAINAGRGYADPFFEPTGPTAWMPPILVGLLAAVHWATAGDTQAVADYVVVLQNLVLIGTGWLILDLIRAQSGRVWLATAVYLGSLVYQFHLSFQSTHDCWIGLLCLDLVVAGLVWTKPLSARWSAAWGLLGGVSALVSPTVGYVWGLMTCVNSWKAGSWKRLVLSLGVAVLTVSPWMIRNYLVFGRMIPVKSNLAFELFQSQCTEPDGVLSSRSIGKHPYGHSAEHEEIRALGEMAYLDHKLDQFCQSVRAHPTGYPLRVGNRFLAATVKYSTYDPVFDVIRPWTPWIWTVVHPIPFLCLVILMVSNWFSPLSGQQRVVIGVYMLYLIPYILVSFYDRYSYPLIAVQVPIVVWAYDRVVCLFGRRSNVQVTLL